MKQIDLKRIIAEEVKKILENEEGSVAPVEPRVISYKLYPLEKDYWILQASSPEINLVNPTRDDMEIARDLVNTIEAHEASHRVEFDDEALYHDARQLARAAAAGATAERGRRRAREQGITNIDTSPFGQSLRRAAEED